MDNVQLKTDIKYNIYLLYNNDLIYYLTRILKNSMIEISQIENQKKKIIKKKKRNKKLNE